MILGIDGGGTKTLYALCTEAGDVLCVLRRPSIDLAQRGEDGLRAALRDGVRDALREAGGQEWGGLSAVCLGAPCWGESRTGDQVTQRVARDVFGETPLYICNDAEIACAGSFALRPGINIVAGTGTIAFGVDAHGRTARCGGWGHYFADEGSGYWLGMRMLSLFCKQADGRRPKQALYHLAREHFGLEWDFDIIDLIVNDYLPYRDKVAGLQMLLFEAAEQGDAGALDSYREAGCEIALNVKGILERLDFRTGAAVSYSGGIFKAGPMIMDSFRAELEASGCAVVQPLAPPWAGALMRALRLIGRDTPRALEKLIEAGKTE